MEQVVETNATRPPERRLRKWVLFGVLLLGAASMFTWIAWHAQGRWSLIQYFEQRGGQVSTKPLSPGWLSDIMLATVGNTLTDITSVSLQDTRVSDADIDNLSNLARPEFQTLERLNLENTNVTDASLQHVSGLANLDRLILENTNVSDAGLPFVSVLTGLQALNLEQTQVTDAGLPQLKGLIGLEELSLNKTQVTDTGLRHLWSLSNLNSLDIRNSRVTEAGIPELQSHLPNCKVMHSFTAK